MKLKKRLRQPTSTCANRPKQNWAKIACEDHRDSLVKYVFLRELWLRVLPPRDTGWIDEQIASAEKFSESECELENALKRALAAGASKTDLCRIMTEVQALIMRAVCKVLDNGEPTDDGLRKTGSHWSLVRLNEDDEIVSTISGGLFYDVWTVRPQAL